MKCLYINVRLSSLLMLFCFCLGMLTKWGRPSCLLSGQHQCVLSPTGRKTWGQPVLMHRTGPYIMVPLWYMVFCTRLHTQAIYSKEGQKWSRIDICALGCCHSQGGHGGDRVASSLLRNMVIWLDLRSCNVDFLSNVFILQTICSQQKVQTAIRIVREVL